MKRRSFFAVLSAIMPAWAIPSGWRAATPPRDLLCLVPAGLGELCLTFPRWTTRYQRPLSVAMLFSVYQDMTYGNHHPHLIVVSADVWDRLMGLITFRYGFWRNLDTVAAKAGLSTLAFNGAELIKWSPLPPSTVWMINPNQMDSDRYNAFIEVTA